MTHSVTLPGRTLAIVSVNNNLDTNQSGYMYEIEPYGILNENIQICVLYQ